LLILTSVAQALDPTSAYTLAAAFISSCPASNPALPFKPFPSLSVVTSPKSNEPRDLSIKVGHAQKKDWPAKANPAPCSGEDVELSTAAAVSAGSYVTFVSGLTVVSVKGEIQGELRTHYTTLSAKPNVRTGNTTSAAIPAAVEGQSYVFITSKDVEGTFDQSAILFGPAILEVKPQPPTYDPKQQ